MSHRWFIIPSVAIILVAIGFFAWGNLNKNLVYYLTPTEAVEKRADFPDGERFKLGGLVVDGSIQEDGQVVRFQISDGQTTIDVVHEGTPPQLFKDGAGAVVEGAWQGDHFESDVLIVRHDEQYRGVDEEGQPYEPPTGS